MPEKKDKIKNLMIELLSHDGILNTIMDDAGKRLSIRFDPEIISMDDLYDLAEPLRNFGIDISYLGRTD